MDRAYTTEEMVTMIQAYEAHKTRHSESQKRYYERNAVARKAYAAKYYKNKKARLAALVEQETIPPA
jgi:uncharacterized protein YaiL (DUF2058 family)